jgi:hypothetical protein
MQGPMLGRDGRHLMNLPSQRRRVCEVGRTGHSLFMLERELYELRMTCNSLHLSWLLIAQADKALSGEALSDTRNSQKFSHGCLRLSILGSNNLYALLLQSLAIARHLVAVLCTTHP